MLEKWKTSFSHQSIVVGAKSLLLLSYFGAKTLYFFGAKSLQFENFGAITRYFWCENEIFYFA